MMADENGAPVEEMKEEQQEEMVGTETTEAAPGEDTGPAVPGVSEDDRKLFVGGLPQEAKDLDIKEYFGQYGDIDNINLKTDPHTGRSRGFAFIVFKDTVGLNAASIQEAHVIKGKKVTCKKAEAKQGKIYVGKLPEEGVTAEDVQAHFAQFGPVAEVVRPIDKSKNDEPKNFCFVTFEREETAKAMVKEGTATINGHQIDIKKVTPKDNSRGGFGGRGGRGGYGGGYGGYGGGYGDPYGGYGYGGYGYGDPYGGGYGGGYGAPQGGYGGAPPGAGGKMRGAPRGGRGARGAPRGRPY